MYVITRSDSIGGAHVHVRDLATRLLAEGHSVHVLVGGQGPFTRQLSERGIPFTSISSLVRPVDPIKDISAVWAIRQALLLLKPELVSTHSSKAGWLGRVAAKSLGIPVVFTAHGWAFADGVAKNRRRLYVLAEKIAAKFSDRIITVSNHDRELALTHGVAPPSKLVAIHNGMPDIPHGYLANPEGEPPRVVMVARFEEQKDHQTLLKALAQLVDLPWKLELVGDGPLRHDMEMLAQSLGIRQRVEFAGAVDNVAERLARSQIFVLTSRWEGFPRSILEAMRARLPVIASLVGGVAESVLDGVTGFVVPRGDVEAVKHRLEMLLRNPKLRKDMGYKARQRFEQEFTFDRMFGRTVATYREVLAEAKATHFRTG